MSRAALLAGLALALSLAAPPAGAAGRRLYAGRVVIPVGDFGGVGDPHQARGRDGRLFAALAHCHLLRPDDRGAFTGELARDTTWQGRSLTVTLVDGARFHDNRTVVHAGDVAASLKRIGQLGERSPWSAAVAALSLREIDPLRLVITAPRGTSEAELRALLARPEIAVLRGGRPGDGAGCGPFRPTGGDAATRRFEAFDGTPAGRPWLDAVIARRVADDDAEQSAFVFGDVDLAFGDGPRSRRIGRVVDDSRVTFFALPHPRFRGSEAVELRKAIGAFARAERLGRYVEGRATPASSPWPTGLASTAMELGRPAAFPQLPGLTIAFDADDRELGDLARALRDSLRQLAAGTARVVPVAGLDLAAARALKAPDWDLALVRHRWAAATPAQAALELAWALGLTPPGGEQALSGKLKAWADAVVRTAAAVPVLHVVRPVIVRPGVAFEPGAAGLPDLAETWRPR